MNRIIGPLLVATALTACSEPRPERAQPVGREHLDFSDASRAAWTGSGDRPLPTTVWYPAAAGATEEPWHIGVFQAGWSAPGAAVAQTPSEFPLVILSHGTGGAAAQLSWLAEHLATNGYLVAAVNHHGNTGAEDAYLPQGFALWWERSRDLSAVLDQMLAHPDFGARIDTARIGVAGFSLGGYTALTLAGAITDRDQWKQHCENRADDPGCVLPPEATWTIREIEWLIQENETFKASVAASGDSFRDSRVKAAYAIAPVLGGALDAEGLGNVSIPVKVAVGSADDQAVPEFNARPVTQAIPSAELLLLEGVAHYTFLAPCGLKGRLLVGPLCADPDGVDRRAVHGQVADDALLFFEKALNRVSRSD